MASYSEIKSALDEIAGRNQRNLRLIERANEFLNQADTDLAAMPTAYGSIIAEIDAALVANPSEEAFIVAKSEKDQLVADYQALRTRVTNLLSAISGL